MAQNSINSFTGSISQLNNKLYEVLYGKKDEKIDNYIERAEKMLGIKREKMAYIILGVVALYFIIGSMAQILCNAVGFAYPAYASAIRSPNKEDDTKWLVYWTVFAAFSLIDFFATSIMQVFPFYWLAKIIFLIYLYLPQTNGAPYLYTTYIDPLINFIDDNLEKYGIKAKAA